MLQGKLLSSKDIAEYNDKWLRDFQHSHYGMAIPTNEYLKDLACALCDDIPFGYSASSRLATWIFNYLRIHELDKFNKDSSSESIGKNTSKTVFIVEDLFDVNLDGNLDTRMFGIFETFKDAKTVICAQNFTNLKWIGDRIFQYRDSNDMMHIGFINKYPVGAIL